MTYTPGRVVGSPEQDIYQGPDDPGPSLPFGTAYTWHETNSLGAHVDTHYKVAGRSVLDVSTDDVMTVVDANAASALRVQQDARLSSTFAPVHRNYVTGRYYTGLPLATGTGASSSSATVDRVYAYLIEVTAPITVDLLAANVITNQASATQRLGIYKADDTGGLPGTRVAYTAALDCSTTGVKSEAQTATVPAGIYWAVVQTGGASGVVTRATAVTSSNGYIPLGRAAADDVSVAVAMYAARADAALPTTLAGTSWTYVQAGNLIPPGVFLRVG